MTNKDNIMMEIFNEFGSVKSNNRHYVLVINGFFEMLVNVLIKEKQNESTKNVKKYYAERLLFIYTTNLITEDLYNLLNVINKIRNRAAHDPLFKIEKSDLISLNETYQNPANFKQTCLEIFTYFWNSHSSLFSEKFAGVKC